MDAERFPWAIPGLKDEDYDAYDMAYGTAMAPQDQGLDFRALLDGASILTEGGAIPLPKAGIQGVTPNYSNPDRDSRLSAIDQALANIQKEQKGRIGAMNSEAEIGGDQLFASAIAGILPLVIGKMVAGNKGLANNGQIGMTAASSVIEGAEKDNERKKAKAKLEYDLSKEELDDLMKERGELQKQGYSAQDNMALEGMKEKTALGKQDRQNDFLMNLEQLRQGGINNRAANSAARGEEFRDIRKLQMEGSEANRIVQKFQSHPLIKSAAASIQAANNIENGLANPSSVTAGQMATQLAVLAGEVGMKTNEDIKRNLGDTAYSKFMNLQNFASGSAESPLPNSQRAAIRELVSAMRPLAERKIGAVREEMSKSGLAPYLSQQGKLDAIIESLGSSLDYTNKQVMPREAEGTITIENSKGERKTVTREEAKRLGAIR